MTDKIITPAAAGYRMPAEWEPREATWLTWPHNRSDWPGKFATIQWAYAAMVKVLTKHEMVRIVVKDVAMEQRAKKLLTRIGVDLTRVHWLLHTTDRGWIRDYGPIFVVNDGTKKVAAVDFQFTGWGRYPGHIRDNATPREIARQLKLDRFEAAVNGQRFTLEGGSIDVNGAGVVMTTEECLLDFTDQPRNRHLTKEEIEQALCDWLGIKGVWWLGGGIVGDDTHGHVDDLARFVNQQTVVMTRCDDQKDENYRKLEENFERLAACRFADGSAPQIVELPTPAPLYYDNYRLPASYANFLIGAGSVLVPTFNDPADRIALGVLGELFGPDREVVGIHAVDLVLGLGSIHCLSMQQPAPPI